MTRKDEAIAMYQAGATSTAVAEAFGVHYTTVLTWLRAAGLQPRPRPVEGPIMTEVVKAEVNRLKAEGLNGKEIGRKLGINPTLVYRMHSFSKDKPKPIPVLNGAEQRALKTLADKLEAFLGTERGAGQAKVIQPQVRAIRKVLEK